MTLKQQIVEFLAWLDREYDEILAEYEPLEDDALKRSVSVPRIGGKHVVCIEQEGTPEVIEMKLGSGGDA